MTIFFTNVSLSKTTVWFVSVVYFCMSFIILIYENDYSKIYIAIIFVNTKKNGIKLKINNLFIIEIFK